MSAGPLPYKATVALATQDSQAGMLLNITVKDANGTVRGVSQFHFGKRSLQDVQSVTELLATMRLTALRQFLSDSGADPETVLSALSASFAG